MFTLNRYYVACYLVNLKNIYKRKNSIRYSWQCFYVQIIFTVLHLFIMPCCVAIGCSNSDKKGYFMKHFPKDPIRKKLWVAKIKRDKWTPSQHSCICEVSSNIKNSSNLLLYK